MPTAEAPRRESELHTSRQARERLQEMQEGDEPPRSDARDPGAPRIAQWSANCADHGVDERGRQPGGERKPEPEERRPEKPEGGQAAERDDEKVPLRHLGEGRETAGRRLIDGLKGRAPPATVVDAPARPAERLRQPAIEPSAPGDVTQCVVFLGPLPLEQRLGPPVTDLLLPIRADRVAPVMPDHRSGVEAERPASLLYPPAH